MTSCAEPATLSAAMCDTGSHGYVRPDPDAMAAVAALERCLRTRDYAGAAQLVGRRKVAEGLAILAAVARQSWAEQAYWRSVAEWRDGHEALLRERQERDIGELVALIAEALQGEPVSPDQALRNRDVLADAVKGRAA